MPEVHGHLSIGEVIGIFGVKGKVVVNPTTDWPERFRDLKRVFVEDGQGGLKELLMESCQFHKERVLLKFRGVDRMTDALALKGLSLWVPREECMRLPEGHYFIGDIVGRRVYMTSGQYLGTVREILRTGSNDVYVTADDHGNSILIPATREIIRSLEPIIEVESMPGLFEACTVSLKKAEPKDRRKPGHERKTSAGGPGKGGHCPNES